MSGRLRSCAVAAALLRPLVAQAAPPPVAVAIAAPRTAGVVGESLPFTIVVSYDPAFVRDHALPLVQRSVDLPFVVDAPWLGGGEGAVVADTDGGVRVATGGRERAWRRASAANGSLCIELPCRITLAKAGELALADVVVRYAYATAFEDDFLRGRQPVDHQEASVHCVVPTFVAREVPTDGAPAGFCGAVGMFAARAFAEPSQLELGDECTLVLAVKGDGDLLGFPPPPWPAVPGFVVQGMLERRIGDERQFRFDAIAVASAPPLPRLRFVFFDPVAARFVELEPEMAALTVAPRRADRPLSARAQQLIGAQGGGGQGRSAWWWALALGLAVPVAIGFALRRRR